MATTVETSPSQATVANPIVRIAPQPGFQEKVLACPADICICGGGAGPGKTWSLLMDAARNHKREGYQALILRRTAPEITNPGGMWDESFKLYPKLKGKPNETDTSWMWGRTTIKFGHCQHEKDKFKYDGAQLAFIGLDQVEHFTEGQFWHLWSRLRTTCGIKPYLRATANPVPDSTVDPVKGWLHDLIQWWIDKATGYIIPERDGKIRWFYRSKTDESMIWADSKEELIAQNPLMKPEHAISITFIEGKLEENRILMKEDPGYEAKLMALPRVERMRLMDRNWNVRPSAGNVFNRAWFTIVDELPSDCRFIVYHDKAGTQDGGKWSASCKMGFSPSMKRYYVARVVRGQWSAMNREKVIKQQSQIDGPNIPVWVEQEPGSGGKESAENTILNLAGVPCFKDPVRGDKYSRCLPFSAMSEAGNVSLLRGDWNEAYLAELHNFDPLDEDQCKDQVDCSSGAYNKLTLGYGDLVFYAGGKTLGEQAAAAAIHAEKDEHGRNKFEREVMTTHFYWPRGR